MESNNWRPTQPVETEMDAVNWRDQLSTDSRQKIVNKIMETLKRHLPYSGPDGTNELRKIAIRFEEKIYSSSANQTDYLRKISMKMITMESRSQNAQSNPAASGSSGNENKPLESASTFIQSQVQSQGQSVPMSLPPTQAQNPQQHIPQTIQGVQSSSALPSSLTSNNMSAVLGQNSNMQNVIQNSAGNSMGQGMASNMYVNPHRQIQGRQQMISHQQQQQAQNPQYLYQHHLQQQHLKQNFPQGNLSNSLMSSQMQQQPQSALQPSQLQSSQPGSTQTPSVMHPSLGHSAPVSSLQGNQHLSIRHSLLRQQQQAQQVSNVNQQQTQMSQQQQMMHQQAVNGSVPQNQLVGQQNAISDMQQNPQRLLGQQNSIPNLQQQQQQLMAQQGNLQTLRQQQLGPQSSVVGMSQPQPQQQQMLGGSSLQANQQQNMHMLSQSKFSMQQRAQAGASLLPTQGQQQSQPQPPQQQMMQTLPTQSAQQQHQMGMQQPPNLQHDMQQRLQAPGSMLQPPNIVDQQKQMYQVQRLQATTETSSTSLDSTAQTGSSSGGDLLEEIYQKITAMKEMYMPDLNEMYQKVTSKIQQHESLPVQTKPDNLGRLRQFKLMIERMLTFLSLSKKDVVPSLKDKLPQYEKTITGFINTNRPRRPLQQAQVPQSQVHSAQQTQSQITQSQVHDNQLTSSLQSANLLGSVSRSQQSSGVGLQHNHLSTLPGVPTVQQSMPNPIANTSLDSSQGNGLSSLQQASLGSMQQNPGSICQQASINSISSQNGGSALQTNMNNLQTNSNSLQPQHLKQQQEPQMTQQMKQLQQNQMQQLFQKHHMYRQQQQLQQQVRQQLPAQLRSQHVSQLPQLNDAKQQINIKPGMLPQHLATSQRPSYPSQQFKSGTQLAISSPQMVQGASPQMGQHSSPQVDQQNLSSMSKNGTPLQSSNSPFVVPSPSTPAAPSPVPVDSEKYNAGTTSLPSSGFHGRQQTSSAQAVAQSLAIGTLGISASPLRQELPSPDGTRVNGPTAAPGEPDIMNHALERLIKAVNSVSSKALSSSVSDISSVVSMVDRIAGSAPGNGSRASVGEDLVAMTKCRLQTRTVSTHDGTMGSRKLKRSTTATPVVLNVTPTGSISDNFKFLSGCEMSELESTATSKIKRPKVETSALLEEIRDVNQRLIDTVVDISRVEGDSSALTVATQGVEGTIVKCSFTAVSLSPNLKTHLASMQMSPIRPLHLLVPTNYPNCSPVLLDKLPVEISYEHEDLSGKVRSRFSISLRSLSQPMSLRDIAQTWDVCARSVISQYAQQVGGGTFSSKFGAWENVCTTA